MVHVGTLGSELTFAGQATTALLAHRPTWDGPTFLPAMDDVVAAVLDGTIDAGVLTSETSNTACTDTVARILDGDPLYIADEIVVPYRCALLGKPGTSIEDIRHVGGHGSIRQCRAFLEERLPNATAEMHRQNSVVAAREVLEGDGSIAVIGTEDVARTLGLDILAEVVDGGAVGAWWALTSDLRPVDGGQLAAFRVEGSARLQALLDDGQRAGLQIRTVTNRPTGELFGYRYLVVLDAAGAGVPASFIEAHDDELLGVFDSYQVDRP